MHKDTKSCLCFSITVTYSQIVGLYKLQIVPARLLSDFSKIVEALGLSSPEELDASHVRKYTDIGVSKSFAEIYLMAKTGELLDPAAKEVYVDLWKSAKAESFN
jgi:hypothetical protein